MKYEPRVKYDYKLSLLLVQAKEKSLELLKIQRTLETAQWEESMMTAKAVLATGKKTKCDFMKQIVIAGHFAA